MNKEEIKQVELIWRYLDGEITGDKLLKLKEDLATNPHLRKILAEQIDINAALSQSDVIELRKKLKIIHRSLIPGVSASFCIPGTLKWYLTAASFALLITSGYILYNIFGTKTGIFTKQTNNGFFVANDSSEITPVDSSNRFNNVYALNDGRLNRKNQSDANDALVDAKKSEINENSKSSHKKLTGIMFEENPMLESLLIYDYRSKENLEILSPDSEEIFLLNEAIIFKWNHTLDAVRLKIMNNRAVTVFESDIKGKYFKLDQELGVGVYYWKLNSNDENLFTGKFIVKK
ncbi:MAG: hypothetical protein KAT48_13770 [Bacteroidales bacterium]|nr:hypothetical protein [Bacteroidales bacterium]